MTKASSSLAMKEAMKIKLQFKKKKPQQRMEYS